jgi:hypothetical protein
LFHSRYREDSEPRSGSISYKGEQWRA